jgi:hypothetical protein
MLSEEIAEEESKKGRNVGGPLSWQYCGSIHTCINGIWIAADPILGFQTRLVKANRLTL